MPAAIGLVDLGVFLALAFLIALSFAYRYSFGALIQGLVSLLNFVALTTPFGTFRPFGFAAGALDKLDHAIRNTIGRGITDMQAAWNEALSYTATAIHWVGKEIASLSHDTAQAVEGLAVGQVKPWVNKRLGAALVAIAALKARVLALEKTGVGRLEKVTHVVEHKTIVVEHAIAQPDIGAIPRALPKVGQLEREIADALARGRELLKRFGPAALVGTVAFALSRLGITWARCSNVNKVGKRACGMNPDLLESLLADTLLIAGTLSLVEFAREMIPVTDESVSLIRRFWRAA